MKLIAFDKLLITACCAMLALYPLVAGARWHSSSDVHAVLEFCSSLVAVTAGVMVLLHFLTTGRWFFLFISVGFVQVGAEEFVHALFSFDRLWPADVPTAKLAISTTWLAGRSVFVLALILAYCCGRREVAPAKRRGDALRFNFAGFLLSALLALMIFGAQHLSSSLRLGQPFKQALEAGIAGLFLLVFALYYRQYARSRSYSPLMLSILACIVLQVMLHLCFSGAREFYDARWDVAHLLKLIGYFFPIFGVWGETIATHRLAQQQYEVLCKEMAERRRSEAELATYREHLEELVAERTAELEQTLSNLRSAQDQLLQAEKLSALGSMVAGVSHELNTPLGNAQMAITTLIGRIADIHASYAGGGLKKTQIDHFFDEGRKLSDIARRSIERSLELVTSFKQVAVDQTSEQRRAFDLAAVVCATIDALRPSYQNKPWEFAIDVAPGIAMDSYPGPLEQIILNLVQNSIRHGFEGRDRGCVRIEAQVDADAGPEHVVLSLSDDGNGIAPEHVGRIFDPFFTTTLGRGGSGIGLNVTHRIATTLLGGTICVQSPQRRGATFTLRIPQRAPALM